MQAIKNQRLNPEYQQASDGSTKVGIHKLESQLTDRIREAIGEERVSAFGRRCGIGESTIRKYLDGSMPHAINLAVIADTANVNIEWLATGRGPKLRGAAPAPVETGMAGSLDDRLRLRMAIEGVEEGLTLMKQVSTPEKSADLIAGAYELLSHDPKYTKRDVVRLIRIALSYGAPLSDSQPPD